jgi:hypothetical protein
VEQELIIKNNKREKNITFLGFVYILKDVFKLPLAANNFNQHF